MQDPVLLCELFDLYAPLLTERQRDAFSLRYEGDLSLAEIAEQYDISRQGAHDAILHAEETLQKTEERLGFHQKTERLRAALSRAEAASDPDEALRTLLRELHGILEENESNGI